MSRGQFTALTVVLAAAVMAGAGYLAYAAVDHPATAPGRPPAGSVASGTGGSPVTVPTADASATPSAADGAGPGGKGGGGAGGAAVGKPACQNTDVTVSLGQGQGASGHISVLLLFANNAAYPCYLHGFPGAELTDPKGQLKPLDAARTMTGMMGGAEGMAKPPVVKLAPGQTVSAVLEWSDVPTSNSTGSCYTGADVLSVTPPNLTQSTTLSLGGSAQVCGGFQVHPVLPVIGNSAQQ